jgi:hypothetical protein
VMRLARRYPDLPESAEARARADAMLVPEKVAGELAWFARPNGGSASRPYGWAWLLALHDELALHDAPWAEALEPLARDLSARLADYLPKLTYPIRVGTHFNTAFACIHSHRWASERNPALAALIESRARDWFGDDRGCQAWEPGGDEFLSSALTEALLMSIILPRSEFADWFAAFLPNAAQGKPVSLFTPAHVSDRSDGKIAHLDGLNLSRAWCWRRIGAALGGADWTESVAQAHFDAALPHLADDYMGEHWLASFALLALDT